MRNQKYIVMSFLAAGALVGFSLRGLAVPVLARMEIGDPLIAGVISATALAGVIAGVLTFLILNRHPLVVRFTDEVITELRKVTWPDREETIRSTTVVIAMTLFIAVMIAIYDYSWAEITSAVLFSES